MGAMGAFLIALARGGLTISSTFSALRETALMTATLFAVLIGAWIFSNFVNIAGLLEALLSLVSDKALSPWKVVVEISLITPPVGLNVFVLKGVVGDVTTGTIFRGVTPVWIADIFRLLLLVAVPAIVLYLPGKM